MTNSSIHLSILPEYQSRWRSLSRELSGYDHVAIAYSGGVDSTFLVWFAKTVVAKDVLALMVVSPLVCAEESAAARRTAQQLGFTVRELHLDVIADSDITSNTRTRCYSCKRLMLTHMTELARRLGYATLMDGTNAEDPHQYRPGLRALQEFGVISPLARAGLDKAAIRTLSRLCGLPTWNKPSQACLATRIPYGVMVTRELLRRIEEAEAYLTDLGCGQVRVRVHDRLARIELDPADFPLLLDPAVRRQTLQHFRELGFLHVALDLAGYRSGSADLDAG
jgi:pyridinium-3,5-biscarboxylic acid mononucleotide sulfurtransferase